MDDHVAPASETESTVIRTEEDLRALYGTPSERVIEKVMPTLDQHSRKFIELSPFVCLATMGPDGRLDVSPRGDGPGFIGIVDDHTVTIPDRPGNNRLDSLTNIVHNPKVGLLFFVPGFKESMRINGRAVIDTAPALRQAHAVDGKLPVAVVRVTVEESYFHCGKAMIRSGLWDSEAQVDRAAMPGLGTIVKEQIERRSLSEKEQREIDGWVEDIYRTTLY